MMSRDSIAALLALAAAVGGCAHGTAKPDPYTDKGVAAMSAWLDRIPRCSPSQQLKTASFGAAPGDDDPSLAAIISVRGQLTLSTQRACTAVECDDNCCNTCWPAWVVIPVGGDRAGRELGIQKPHDQHVLGAAVMECKLDEMRRRLPRTEVLVSGFVEHDELRDDIVDASLCVIPPPPGPPAAPAP